MRLTVYADFTCPLSFLAHQRARRVADMGLAEIRWRAVVADPRRPVTGRLLTTDAAAALREVVLATAQPHERVPVVAGRLSWAGALTAAYAESVTDGVEDEVREAFLSALWEQGADLSDAMDVRRVVAGVMDHGRDDVLRRLPTSPVVPLGIGRDAGMRRAGATTTRLGHPLTTAGYRRQSAWASALALHRPLSLPLVVTDGGQALAGRAALQRFLLLADPTASERSTPRGRAPGVCPEPGAPTSLLAAT